ncbi:MAG: OmpA family protein [Candidatus Eisenbacteria bacterium]|nr:OmpA family protein [Candidatus Eisenbacteria bacterium]
MRRPARAARLAAFLLIAASAAVAAASETTEHTFIRPYPGAVCRDEYTEHEAFSAFEFPVTDPETGEKTTHPVKGEYWYLYYEMLDGSGELDESVSEMEFLENYKSAAREKGGEIHFDDSWNGYLTFTVPRDDGGLSWCYAEASDGAYSLWIVDEQPFEKKLTFSAAEIKRRLDADGRIAVYGILFDTDKADLKPEAMEPLGEIVKLMLQYTDLSIEIQGHTDNQGTAEHNLDLSRRRADTVRRYILLFGVDEKRLVSDGYGLTRPVAPNDSEEGRAKNRRVELVKR